jgi:WS/DGAT/MGAT family acyltransferase
VALAGLGVRGAVSRVTDLAGGAIGAVTHAGETLGRAREVAAGLGEVLLAGLNAAPDTPLNVAPGPHRRIAVARSSLADVKQIKNALGGTVNDVVLAVVAAALRDFLHSREVPTDDLELKACVPVSVRSDDQRGALGNQLTQIVAPLPVSIADPERRLNAVRKAMAGIKDSRQALGAKAITALQDFAPPTLFAQASRMNFAARFYNVLVTNVPGPQFPLYLLGHRLEAMFPIAFLAGDRALAIAIISYDGELNYGLIGDFDALPELQAIADGIESATQELLSLAKRRGRQEARRAKRR